MIMRSSFSFRDSYVFFFAISASILLSFLANYHQTIINPDAICYLLSAKEVGYSGMKGAMHLCGQAQWPFYPVLIYSFAKYFHLSYLSSAYILNGIFSLLTVLTFMMIVKELKGSSSVLWLAAGVILCAHTFNSVREYIIRDHGFWSFYLISIFLLLRYFQQPTLKIAFSWSISLLIASLFRIEGMIFLISIPFLTWFDFRNSFKQKLKIFFELHSLLIILSLIFSLWFFYKSDHVLEKFGRISELPYQMQHGLMLIANRYQAIQVALAQHVLTVDARGKAGSILMLVFVAWYLISVMSNLSWIYVLLFIYTLWNKATSFTSHAKFVLYSYLTVNFFVTFTFLLERNFLSKRYLIALSLVLMLWIPFGLHHFIKRSVNLRYYWQLVLVLTLIFFTVRGDFFGRGYSKSYVQEAGQWMSKNIPNEATLYVNDYQLMFYSNHFGNQIFNEVQKQRRNAIAGIDWKQYDFLALRLNQKEEDSHLTTFSPLQVFRNKHGDRVVIYKVK